MNRPIYPTYTTYFETEEYESELYNFSNLPNGSIESIILHLPNGKNILFEGFEKYLVIQTDYHIVQGGKGKVFDTLNILCKKGDEVCQVTYHRKGKLLQFKNEWGKEWRPCDLKPLPKDEDGNKQYAIEGVSNECISTDQALWHTGLIQNKAIVKLIGENNE